MIYDETSIDTFLILFILCLFVCFCMTGLNKNNHFDDLTSRHMTSKQRGLTSMRRRIDVNATLCRRHVPAGLEILGK